MDQWSELLLFPPLCNFAATDDGFGAEQPTSSPHINKQVTQNNEKIRNYFSFVCNQKPESSQTVQPKACSGTSPLSKTTRDLSWCCWCWDGPSTLTAYTERPSQLISFHAMGMLPQAADSLLRQALVWDATAPVEFMKWEWRAPWQCPQCHIIYGNHWRCAQTKKQAQFELIYWVQKEFGKSSAPNNW